MTIRRLPSKRRIVRALILAVLIALIASELVARFGLGLGDPPLFINHPTIEYLYKPSSSYRRFGNAISFNAFSMRSEEFALHKSSPDELRILVMGDSVVNGGVLTDQSELATELLQHRIAGELNRPVVVGNVATGSWGPPNLLAYAREFGLFQADIIIIVISSHDHVDALKFDPLGPDMPRSTPTLAIQEAIQRYLPRYVPFLRSNSPPERTADQLAIDRVSALTALRELLDLVQSSGANVHLVQHFEQPELAQPPQEIFAEIAAIAADAHVSVSQLADAFSSAFARGEQPYRDEIHPSALGQQLMSDHFHEIVTRALASREAPSR
jgi:lysophospholipase L1-like esterase